MNELALFAGTGGSILGGKLCGFEPVCAVENDPFRIGILLARQNDNSLSPFPIWDDVCTFDGLPWRGVVDVVSAGFPCQDIAHGTSTQTGIAGERSGLWGHAARVIGEVRPSYAILENSSLITSRGLEVVLADLAGLGYDAEWGVFRADQAGANHPRKRWFLVASDPNQVRCEGRNHKCDDARREKAERLSSLLATSPFPKRPDDIPGPWVLRVSHGVPYAMDAVRALGDAQVPAVVRLAWHALKPTA
jgi:DNA (cytosine-5)-methyltransferase 1